MGSARCNVLSVPSVNREIVGTRARFVPIALFQMPERASLRAAPWNATRAGQLRQVQASGRVLLDTGLVSPPRNGVVGSFTVHPASGVAARAQRAKRQGP